ncbi:efflux RND transporter periplasmic adaptor subunit [Pontiella sp.]|uniref:efflux RND transporter periplasmic adaptor subunit n=1 Tax=Pontiella sp. TaxID=2837462 RepID=UPI0035637DB4
MRTKTILIALFAAAALTAPAQTGTHDECDCDACKAKKEGVFTLPALQGLGQTEPQRDEHAGHDHALQEATGQAEPVAHDHDGDGKPDHGEHDGHDHAVPEADPHAECTHDHEAEDAHAGHDHGAESGGMALSEAMIQKVGIRIHEAEGGRIAKSSVFPAEIKLNRDTTAAVSPRYAGMVRKVFVEIGDAVEKGDPLATLENSETMAVYTLEAPQNGVIISKDLAVGEVAAAGKVLYEVADLSSVWADINVFPKYRHLMRNGMEAEFIAHDGCRAHGTIRYISPIIAPETRTFTARCILTGARADFTPGAYVRARIDTESVQAEVAVPSEAVQTIEGEAIVFVPSADGFVTAPVQLGLSDGRSVEIKRGLQPGQKYVAAGAFSLKAKMVTSGMDPHAGHGH